MKSLAHTGTRSPDRSARSFSLQRLGYPSRQLGPVLKLKKDISVLTLPRTKLFRINLHIFW